MCIFFFLICCLLVSFGFFWLISTFWGEIWTKSPTWLKGHVYWNNKNVSYPWHSLSCRNVRKVPQLLATFLFLRWDKTVFHILFTWLDCSFLIISAKAGAAVSMMSLQSMTLTFPRCYPGWYTMLTTNAVCSTDQLRHTALGWRWVLILEISNRRSPSPGFESNRYKVHFFFSSVCHLKCICKTIYLLFILFYFLP